MNDILKQLDFYHPDFLKSVPQIGISILMIIIGVQAANWLNSLFQRKISQRYQDPFMGNFLAKAIKLMLIVFIILLALIRAGLSSIASAIVATTGASAIIIGFAFKDIHENFLAGIILAFIRPFHMNDTVQIENVFGKVKAMEFRYTTTTTFDGRNVYIPNSDGLTKPIF